MTAAEPALSVILTTRGGWAPVARTLGYLAEQNVAGRIEVVLVLLGGESAENEPPDALSRLWGHQLVPAPEARSLWASTLGVRPVRRAASMAALLGIWQLANAAGYALERGASLKQGRRDTDVSL